MYSWTKLLLLCLFAFILPATSAKGQGEDSVIYNTDFASLADLSPWTHNGKYKFVSVDNYNALRLKSKNENKITLELPVDKVRGKVVNVYARLKLKNISTPPNTWNGVKLMLHNKLPWTSIWPQATIDYKTKGWFEVNFSADISEVADSVQLILGLEKVSGTIWLDKVRITATPTSATSTHYSARGYSGHTTSRLRGAMVNTFISPDDLHVLASWGANLIRWQITWNGHPRSNADTAGPAAYTAWLDAALKHLDSLIPICKQLGIKIVIDLHSLPGGLSQQDGVAAIFRDNTWQNIFQQSWKMIAAKYQSDSSIWGYDLANEPVEGIVPAGLLNWHDLATVTAAAIRDIDTTHAIIYEGIGGTLDGLINTVPIQIPKVVYSFHMYIPMDFTGQGLDESPPVYYPGAINGSEWNKETLRNLLSYVQAWKDKYNAHIYVGEFSAIRWAPGESAYNYIKDCIELFEDFGWDWTYHAFREYNGWSVEFDNNKFNNTPAPSPTSRQKLLMEWFTKNKK